MNIKHVLTFITVAEYCNFTKAAEKLNYAQSTISFHIKSLEDELGVKLFHRKPSGLTLTDKGMSMISTFSGIKDYYYELLDIAGKEKCYTGPIKIGTSESFLLYKLSDVIKKYGAIHPNISLQISNKSESEYEKLLIENEIDLAVFTKKIESNPNIECQSLGCSPMYLIYPPNYEFVSLEKLSNDLTACITENGCIYQTVMREFHNDNHVSIESSMETWSIEVIKKLISSGIGYSILPKMCIENDIKLGQINAISLNSSKYDIEYMIGYKKVKEMPSAINRFIDMILTSLF
ncbi:MAG: LysR family transcriptional regulator [Tissierellales bacterium]|jgi:DNA-binding transcriptional LysR family regulator|nr:LysR family transcriptional regulator [Tissierellales bacterium]